jgi:hypothetical protein
MKRIACILIGVVFILSGCDDRVKPDSPEVLKKNEYNLSKQGVYVGTLPNGEFVYRYEIDMGGYPNHPNQFMYYISDVQPVTVNYNVPNGKFTRNETIVIIDGVKYTPIQNETNSK